MTALERCPQCGFDNPSSVECPRCGIVFAKVHQPSESSPRKTAEPPRRTSTVPRQPQRITLLPWLLVAVTVTAVVVGFDVLRTDRPESPAPMIAQEAKPETDGPAQAEELQRSAVEVPSSTVSPPTDWPPAGSLEPVQPTEPDPVDSPAPTPSYDWYEGASGFVRGVEEARTEGKPLAVYFYTDWCPYCRELESELLSRAKVEDSLKYLVKIRINPERGARERAIADRYGVQGYPSFFVQPSPQARPLKMRRTVGDRLLMPEEFVANLEAAAR